MKICLKTIFVLLFSLSNLGCHNGNEDCILSDNRELQVTVQFRDNLGIHADLYAKMYIYYGIYITDILNYTYTTNGILKHGDKLLIPNIELEMEGKEHLVTTIDNTKKITIIIESSIYDHKIMTYSVSPDSKPINYTCIFSAD